MSDSVGHAGGRPLYPAYAGLGRVAMFWGVPLMAALVVFTAAVAAALVGAATLGPGGLLLAVPAAPVFLYCRQTCATDDQALRILWFELLCFIDRTNTRCFGRTYTLAPMKYGRRLDSARRTFDAPGSRGSTRSSGASFVARFYEQAEQIKRAEHGQHAEAGETVQMLRDPEENMHVYQ